MSEPTGIYSQPDNSDKRVVPPKKIFGRALLEFSNRRPIEARMSGVGSHQICFICSEQLPPGTLLGVKFGIPTQPSGRREIVQAECRIQFSVFSAREGGIVATATLTRTESKAANYINEFLVNKNL